MKIYAIIELEKNTHISTKLYTYIVAQFDKTNKVLMIKFIDKIILEFRACFTRKSAFKWFAVIVIGFMLRSDSMGVTSVIRDMCLNEGLYATMMHFFRASSWTVPGVFKTWCHIILKYAPIMRDDDGSVILVGDGTKISKEAKHMPGVKKHHQDSENSGKAAYIFGHLFGCIGILASNTDNPDKLIKLVTKAKSNVTAYEKPVNTSRRGRPCKKGRTIHLKELFGKQQLFNNMQMFMYGNQETVRYYAVNLLWKQGLYQELRFVLVQYKGVNSILVTTDLSMSPEAVIRMYAHRFNIECTFKTMKQLIGVGCYHFWSKYMPKLNKYSRTDKIPVNDRAKEKIHNTLNAIEKYVMLCCVATGILQMLILTHSSLISPKMFKYRRTVSSNTPTEDIIADYLRRNLFRFMFLCPNLAISQFIMAKQLKNGIGSMDMAA